MEQPKTAQSPIIAFLATEKEKKLARYRYLNERVVHGQVLFTGSSLMEEFPINEMLATRGIPIVAYNRGIGGLKTDDMLMYMEEMVFGTEPSKIFINIGTNDIGGSGYSLEHLLDNYGKILSQIRERLGSIPIYVMAYYPVNASDEVTANAQAWVKRTFQTRTNENINIANQAVKTLARSMGCTFIDVNDGLKDEDGNMKKEFAVEGIHMYPNGYEVVLDNLMPYLKV